jgi:NAD(P)-dependent dehydrogenase (short-subunit alcohol dehydrogenase family)
MAGRVEGKVALVVGGGQTPGETVGNGRATAIVLAREGAKVVVADRNLASAKDTVAMIKEEGGDAYAVEMDVLSEDSVKQAVADAVAHYGRLDILHNNVGASGSLGDGPVTDIDVAVYDRVVGLNLRGMLLTCKYALPELRKSGHGSIVNISSMAARHEHPMVGYKTTKAAVIALTENVAAANAAYNVRANAILPGKINTPMAIEPRVATGRKREEVVASRDKMIPLGGKMGTGWDVANAALFLHSEDARFITGVSLPVDGGEAVKGGAG